MQIGKTLGFFAKKDNKRLSWGQDTAVAAEASSTPSTSSVADVGKEQPNEGHVVQGPSIHKPVIDMEEKGVPAVANLGGAEAANEPPIDEKHGGEQAQDDVVYPTGIKLGIISMALCLSVFLLALVSHPFPPSCHNARPAILEYTSTVEPAVVLIFSKG